MVLWENTADERILERARDEIWQSWRRACAENVDHPRAKELFDRKNPPASHDPFAGGGALPLEAQRLGLESYASDLNPVAVLICKAMIEIPPKFAGNPPANPESRRDHSLSQDWRGTQALAEDVRFYGQWIRDEAEKRIGYLYPQVEVTAELAKGRADLKPLVGKKLTVIGWLWARTVKSPNPAFAQLDVPLASTFKLSAKVGKETYVDPVIDGGGYRFTVRVGKPRDEETATAGTSIVSRDARGKKIKVTGFRCVLSGAPITMDHVQAEAKAGRRSGRKPLPGAFAELYRAQGAEFPPECRDADYEKRIQAAFPIHPEIFDRLYTDWSTLVKFQRTRGVLRLMAAVIHSLWEKGDRNPLMLPSTIPIDDPRVRDEMTRYLSDNWKPIIEKDVDGANSLPLKIDSEVPNLGRLHATRRVARTLYLGSAPTAGAAHRGIEDRRVKLGCVMPGESPAVFGDALRRLTSAATYLYHDGSRYWYSTQPTVTKLAEDRAEQLKRDPDAVVQELDKRLRADLRKTGDFARVHPLPQSGQDVPDDMDAGLVVLGIG